MPIRKISLSSASHGKIKQHFIADMAEEPMLAIRAGVRWAWMCMSSSKSRLLNLRDIESAPSHVRFKSEHVRATRCCMEFDDLSKAIVKQMCMHHGSPDHVQLSDVKEIGLHTSIQVRVHFRLIMCCFVHLSTRMCTECVRLSTNRALVWLP